MQQQLDKSLFPPIEKSDWERVLKFMVKYNRFDGFVDYDSKGKIQFYDSDPFIGGVHAMPVDLKIINQIINYY